jgi:predicted phosphodiesterase
MSFKNFQIVSDLHIEFRNDEIPEPLELIEPTAPILILAGDIGSLYKIYQLSEFLKKLCVYFEKVFYVPGNHEYYTFENIPKSNINILVRRLRTLEKVIPNLQILDRDRVVIDDICIAGCTLWSKLDIELPKYIVRIHGMTTEIYNDRHTGDLEFIRDNINYCKSKNLKLLLITHHCPTYKVIYNSRKRKKLHSLYCTNLDDILSENSIHTWVCGHTHQNFDIQEDVGGTRIVSNQKGKPLDFIEDYSKNFVIIV